MTVLLLLMSMLPTLQSSVPLPPTALLQQYTSRLTAVWWGWRQTPGHGRQPPFLDIRFYEHETALAKVDVDVTRAVCANCRKEILGFETVRDIIELFAIAREEDGARSGAVADTNDIAGCVGRAVLRGREWLVVTPGPGGEIGKRVTVVSCRERAS